MNENITYRIKQYLELDTNYAIIINGNYGIGKTHYIKNELFPEIKDLKIPDLNEDEKYIPIFISLFGAKSIEDLENQTFFELYPILKSKGVKILGGLAKAALKYIGTEAGELLSDIGTTSGSLTDYSKILICIDDIDRKSSELELKEVFGFVNNLVENYNAKIILIANEDELRKELSDGSGVDHYSLLREKVVGISITFKNNVDQIYDEIINEKYETTNESYFQFLTENKKLIVDRIKGNNNNLRSLLFFLEHFKIVFEPTKVIVNDYPKYESIKDEILSEILSFTLPISIEYKTGLLNNSNYNDITNLYHGHHLDIPFRKKESEEDEVEKTYVDIYKEKYISNKHNVKYFATIFNYIIGASSFNIKNLDVELQSLYKFEEDSLPEREKILKKLGYWSCVDLKQIEYRKLTYSLLSYVDKGEFGLEQYVTVFHYTTRFNNILGFDLKKLLNRFKKGISKGEAKYVPNIHMRLIIDPLAEFSEEQKVIADYCIEMNEKIKLNQEVNKVNELFELMISDFKSFSEKIQDNNSEFRFYQFFSRLNSDSFWKTIKKFKNSELIELGFLFSYRYRPNIFEGLYPEKEFLKDLLTKIEEYISSGSAPKLKLASFKFLKKLTQKSLDEFPEKT